MPWYCWVIAGLAVALMLVSLAATVFVRAFGELANIVVGTWVKGNFGKRRE